MKRWINLAIGLTAQVAFLFWLPLMMFIGPFQGSYMDRVVQMFGLFGWIAGTLTLGFVAWFYIRKFHEEESK